MLSTQERETAFPLKTLSEENKGRGRIREREGTFYFKEKYNVPFLRSDSKCASVNGLE